MEHITLASPPPDLIERITEAVKWLSDIPPPADHVIGPLGGGRIRCNASMRAGPEILPSESRSASLPASLLDFPFLKLSLFLV